MYINLVYIHEDGHHLIANKIDSDDLCCMLTDWTQTESKLYDTRVAFLEVFFFKKKALDDNKSMEKISSMKITKGIFVLMRMVPKSYVLVHVG